MVDRGVNFTIPEHPVPYGNWDIVWQSQPLAEIMEWTDERTGITTLFGIELAKQVCVDEKLPVYMMEIGFLAQDLSPNIERTSLKRFNDVDLTVPVLVSLKADPDLSMVVIDGWGRIQKAHEQGIKELPAVFIPPEFLDRYVLNQWVFVG